MLTGQVRLGFHYELDAEDNASTVSSALQGRRPNGRYGCDRTGPRRGCCHCRHERVEAGVVRKLATV